MAGMKGINNGYSGLMTRLRICIGLIAAALFVSALPAHADTAFRTAKVCAQTQSGIKIVGVQFKWTFPGTVGGSGKTDNKGCFAAQYLPVGDVQFTWGQFVLESADVLYLGGSSKVTIGTTGLIMVLFSDPKNNQVVSIKALAPDGKATLSNFYFRAIDLESECTENVFAGDRLLFGGHFMWNLLTDNQDGTTTQVSSLDMGRPWPTIGTNWAFHAQWSVTINKTPAKTVTLRLFELPSSYGSSQLQGIPCIQAKAVSGTQTITAYAKTASTGNLNLIYSEYLQGFKDLPTTLKAKSGKIMLTTTLHDNQNQPTSGTPVTVSEPKAKNPNIGKKVGSCKPVLTATTNAQGKATFTLCPTKNTTVTVKAPPFGIVSQSITVTK